MAKEVEISPSNLSANVFAGCPLDRKVLSRKNTSFIDNKFSGINTRFVVYWRGRHLIKVKTDPPVIYLGTTDISYFLDGNEEIVFLGETQIKNSISYFGIDLSHVSENLLLDKFEHFSLMDIRDTVQIISREDASIIAYTRGLLYWHSMNHFCGVCGSKTQSIAAGHERKCLKEDCNSIQFPRTDPAVIVLVYNGDFCLLGRQKSWPDGMHSTLAGFVEPGESLEEAVRREVLEESGALVTDIIYHSSQPWPLPGSLMVGFTARAYSKELKIDYDELETAVWVNRRDLKEIKESNNFRLPGNYSIARRLIEDWILE